MPIYPNLGLYLAIWPVSVPLYLIITLSLTYLSRVPDPSAVSVPTASAPVVPDFSRVTSPDPCLSHGPGPVSVPALSRVTTR